MTVNTASVLARIETFASQFDVPMPDLTFEDDDILVTDAFIEWHREHGTPFNWLISGDVSALLQAHRAEHEWTQPIVNTVGKLDEEERRVLLAALEAHAEGVALDEALSAMRQVVERRRGGAGAGSAANAMA